MGGLGRSLYIVSSVVKRRFGSQSTLADVASGSPVGHGAAMFAPSTSNHEDGFLLPGIKAPRQDRRRF
jgi:hypothetical protein